MTDSPISFTYYNIHTHVYTYQHGFACVYLGFYVYKPSYNLRVRRQVWDSKLHFAKRPVLRTLRCDCVFSWLLYSSIWKEWNYGWSNDDVRTCHIYSTVCDTLTPTHTFCGRFWSGGRDIAYMRGKEIIKVGTDASNILYVLNLLVARDSSADSDYMIWNTDEIRSDIRSDRFSFNSEPLWRMRGCDVAKVRCMNLNLEFFGNSQASYHQVIKYNLLIIFSLTMSPFQLWLADTPNSYFFDKKCVFYSTSSCDA